MQLTFGDADGTWMRCASDGPPAAKLLPLFVEELRQIDVLRVIREAPEKTATVSSLVDCTHAHDCLYKGAEVAGLSLQQQLEKARSPWEIAALHLCEAFRLRGARLPRRQLPSQGCRNSRPTCGWRPRLHRVGVTPT